MGIIENEERLPPLKPLYWVGSSRSISHKRAASTSRPSRSGGLALPGVLEVVEDWNRSTYRAVYTARFRGSIFVLHVFQKKSKRGAATPKADIDLVRERLRVAEQMAKELSG